MANVNHKLILQVLKEENRWLTFDELYDKMHVEYDYFVFLDHLNKLVKQGKIQYIPAQGMDRAYYGDINLEE